MTGMDWLSAGLLLAATGCALQPAMIARRFHRHVRRWAHQPRTNTLQPEDAPSVAVILPVRGIASEMPELESNLAPVLGQDYPRYQVIFAVGEETDPAMPVLQKLCAAYPHARTVVAGTSDRRSQKICNQLRALEAAGRAPEVLVFLDSDARPAPWVLRRLVAALDEPGVGAATGYRWYTPAPTAGWASWLRAAWNGAGIPLMCEPRYSYAWGGAMAIRRDVFEACGVAEYWSLALSDDLGLSHVVRQAGYTIRQVPDCAVRSPEDLSLGQVMEWTRRQTLICRVYHPVMWRDLLLGELLTHGLQLAALIAMALALAWGQWSAGLVAGVAVLVIAAGQMAFQTASVRTVRIVAPELIAPGAIWRMACLAPMVNLLTLWVSLSSACSRRMTWRGITYDLAGPRDIRIVRHGSANDQPERAALRGTGSPHASPR